MTGRGIRSVMVTGLLLGLTLALSTPAPGDSQEPAALRLLIAFSTVRDRRAPPYPVVHFYEHDGVANGKLVGSVDTMGKGVNTTRGDMHPTLSGDGRLCAFSAQFGVMDGARIEIWDRKEKKLLDLPVLNDAQKVHRMQPSLSADANLVAFAAWAWPGAGPRWDVFVWDRTAKKPLDVPQLNTDKHDERMPALSSDGRFLAYTSNAPGGVGGTDIYLYDLGAKKVVALPEMNSRQLDTEPSLSGDGRLVAFVSDRPGGSGGRDIYLYDRQEKKFLPLPGLNSVAHDQSPSLSADGRFIAFVSERLGGAGERDIYLYDRQVQKLLPTPGLNSKEDDFDPCVIVLRTPE
jgi:Tol biopolymer transport system component